MSEKQKKGNGGNPDWVKGVSANPAGAPKRRRRIKKSELRKLEQSLKVMEPKALENMEKSINGEIVDKLVLESSRWLITSILNVSKAAGADELNWQRLQMNLFQIEKLGDEDSDEEPTQSVESIEQEAPKRLSLVYVNPDSDEE